MGTVNRPLAIGLAVLALLTALPARSASAQTAENVAVVINVNSEASQRIGEYYAKRRGIPESNVIRLRTAVDEAIDRDPFVVTIQQPIAAALAKAGLQDRVLYIVLTKGVPLVIKGSRGQDGTISSVDSELTLLYRRMTGVNVFVRGRIDNPYYLAAREVSTAQPFTHREHDIYLVTRLDAFTTDEALALVDKGLSPSTDGRVVLDQQDRISNRTGEEWLARAAERLTVQGQGDRVVLENTVKPARGIKSVLGYYSWGSSDPRNRVRKVEMGFVPGSLAATFVSADARTFKEPPVSWVPNASANKATWFADSPQSLIGDLIREGATGVAGHVVDPYLQSVIRPEILFPAYLSGLNLAEAFYAAMPHLSWQTVIIGDPLCAPFRKQGVARSEIEGGTDTEMLLPAAFGKRRLAQAKVEMPEAPERALVLAMRGDTLLARGDRAGAREAWEEATKLAPRLAGAQMQLALLHEQAGEVDPAIERYRRVIDAEPKNALALNNLAYRLATERNAAAEALPLASRAVAALPQSPTILDTLAWIQHLLGDQAAAVKTMAAALKYGPRNAEIRLHAAIIYEASGARAVAQDQLSEAVKLSPALEKSEDVRQLRARLQQPSTGK